MKTKLILLGISFIFLGFSVIAVAPKFGIISYTYVSKSISNWRIARQIEIHKQTMKKMPAIKESLEDYALLMACAQSVYDNDHAYRDAAYNLAEKLQGYYNADPKLLTLTEDALIDRMRDDREDWQAFFNWLDTTKKEEDNE